MAADSKARIDAAEEQAVFNTRREETGTVRVDKRTRTTEQTVEGCVETEGLEVRRLPADRWVDGPVPIREENGVTIVSLVEEVAVVEKRLHVFEEIHLVRTVSRRPVRESVPVRRQDVSVTRNDSAPDR